MLITLIAVLFHIVNNSTNPMKPKINMNILGVTICLDASLALALVVFT